MSPLLPFIYSQVPAIAIHAVITLDLQAPWNIAACAWSLFVCWTCSQHAKTNIILIDYTLGVFIAFTAMDAIHLTLLVRPLYVFRHQKQTQPAHKLPWFDRFIWATKLCGSPRGIGWDHQVKNLPENSTNSRKEFVLLRLMIAAKHYLWFDLAQSYMRHSPAFKSPAAFASLTLSSRLIASVIYMICYYSVVVVVHALIVALIVSCTSADPSSWPNMFGNWGDAYTIGRCWGRAWHQLIRRFLSPFGKRLASFLGFPPGTKKSSYIQLYTAFIVSGVAHIGGDAMINPSRLGLSFPFFIYQASAITFESIIIAAAQRAGVKETGWTRVMGYVWVMGWFSATLTSLLSAILIAGAENGGQLVPFQYFPPSLCDILVNL